MYSGIKTGLQLAMINDTMARINDLNFGKIIDFYQDTVKIDIDGMIKIIDINKIKTIETRG